MAFKPLFDGDTQLLGDFSGGAEKHWLGSPLARRCDGLIESIGQSGQPGGYLFQESHEVVLLIERFCFIGF